MKKIFVIAGVFSFSFASAQENNFFDIDKHLQKKNKKKIIIPLKRPQAKIVETKDAMTVFPGNMATLSHILPNGNKVYLLPQSNMPCIVPEMHQFNMPVTPYDSIQGIMPNVWRNRSKIIPE